MVSHPKPPTDRIFPRPADSDPVRWKIQQWEQIIPGGGFDQIESAARIIHHAARLTEAMDRIARREGLANQNDYQVLSVLRIAHHTGQRLTITELAAQLNSTTATMVNRIDRLQDHGLLERTPHPTDRRSLHLALTPDGAASVERMVEARTRQREQWLTALTTDERATLKALLNKLPAPGRFTRTR